MVYYRFISALRSNAIADASLLISVLIVFKQESFLSWSRCVLDSSRSSDYEREYARYLPGEAEAMSLVLSTGQAAAQSPYYSLYSQSYDGIHQMLSRG